MKDKIKEKLLIGCKKNFQSWVDTRISLLSFIDNPSKEYIKKDEKMQKKHDEQFICGNKKLCPECELRLKQHEETKKLYEDKLKEKENSWKIIFNRYAEANKKDKELIGELLKDSHKLSKKKERGKK